MSERLTSDISADLRLVEVAGRALAVEAADKLDGLLGLLVKAECERDGVREELARMAGDLDDACFERDRLRAAARSESVVVEYAQGMSSGDMLVRWNDPEAEDAYPLAKWIPAKQRFGGKVFRRTIRVVEDWVEVPRNDKKEEGN